MADSPTQQIVKKKRSEKQSVYRNFSNSIPPQLTPVKTRKASKNIAFTLGNYRKPLIIFYCRQIIAEGHGFFVLTVNIGKRPIKTAYTRSGNLQKAQRKTRCSLEYFQFGKIASKRQVFFM